MCECDNLQKDLGEIRALLNTKNDSKTNTVEKYTKIIQTSLYVLALILGAGVSWGMTSSKLADIDRANTKVQIIEDRVHDLEIRQATESEILNSIKADLSEIKDELHKLNRIK